MNSEFPKIITEQRKQRKLSQKQVANDLGISQALLSHYEKGIRECGLDFVIKIADYYNVSCDFILGRETTSDNISLQSESIVKAINNLLSLYKESNIEKDVSDLLTLNLYKLLSITNNQTENKLFEISPIISENLTDSVIMNISASIKLKYNKVNCNLSENTLLKKLIADSERKISKFHSTL